MNFPDFHTVLLWLRSIEICIGIKGPLALINEIEHHELFATYHSPYKA